MRVFFLLVRLRILDTLRSASSALFFLGFPVVLLVVLGLVFMNGHPFERRPLSLVGPAGDPALARIEATLSRFPDLRFEHDETEQAGLGKLRSHVVNAVLVREQAGLVLLVGPRDELFGRGLAGALPEAPSLRVLPVPRWGYVHYLFPGLLTFSVLIGGLFGMGYVMARFRQNLFLKKLSVTPLPKTTFVAAQVLSRAALVLLQLVLLVIAARLFFDLPLSAVGALWLLLFTLLGLLTFMGAGFALACVIKTEALMVDVINAVTTPLVLLSEIFFSAAELPAPLPALASALPSTQMVRLIRAVILHGVTAPGPLLPGIAVLAGWALVAYVVSMLAFRWND